MSSLGAFNGFLIVVCRLDSFIATLGSGSIFQAILVKMSGNQSVIGLPTSFQRLGQATPPGIPILVIYLAVIALIFWYVLEHTTTGRYLHAIGRGREVARLAGVRTGKYIFLSLVALSAIAAFAGAHALGECEQRQVTLAGSGLHRSYE